jgi:hypothetical protein
VSTTHQLTPTSHLRLGHGRVEITPPVGIYHRMWGAARHDRASGVHRPLIADLLAFAPLHEAEDNSAGWIQAQFDMVGLGGGDHQAMIDAIVEGSGLAANQVVLSYSHSHSAGFFSRDRAELPGGELIGPHLEEVKEKVRAAARLAVHSLSEVILTYGFGRCGLVANRDYWDSERSAYACGFNPDAPADDTVVVARATSPQGRLLATLVNYACHPTTLAWDNTLISPDYIGAMRATVEQATGAPCIFSLGACGDLGPRQGYLGDPQVADCNGRQLGYAALAALERLDPPGQDFSYLGPVVSGATLGAWGHTPQNEQRASEVRTFAGGAFSVDLAQRERPDAAQLALDLAGWLERQQAADSQGDTVAARDYGAHAERARRWLRRLGDLPSGPTYPFGFTVRRVGDAFWVSTGGEPYNALQTRLRESFPNHPVVVSVLAGELSVAYLLPADRYGRGLYQEEPSILAKGCLETLGDAIIAEMESLVAPGATETG